MTQYSTLNIKLSNSQFSKWKSAIKNGSEATLNLSSNLIGSSNDETNFPHKLLLSDTQVLKIRKALAHDSSANIKFYKIYAIAKIHAMFLAGKEALKKVYH